MIKSFTNKLFAALTTFFALLSAFLAYRAKDKALKEETKEKKRAEAITSELNDRQENLISALNEIQKDEEKARETEAQLNYFEKNKW